ncbi:hypothetical protein [Candidatus Thiosymbion oneisti]|uniref:hypothetical protein n=1 Tax=Candidatus Thiosymbion oneisti TaxID=589554 RepID=UPI001A9C991B|nr:hypothetical protein [Candidatus Thiosymbion oneisti]
MDARTGAPAVSTSPPAPAVKICRTDGSELELFEANGLADIVLVGRRNDTGIVPGYWFDPGVAVLDRQPYHLDLSESRGRLLPVELPVTEWQRLSTKESEISPDTSEKSVLPVRFPGLDRVPRVVPGSDNADTAPNRINILVIGDAPTVEISGLAVVEDALREENPDFTWGVFWHDVAADGSVAEPESFKSLMALMMYVQGLAAEKRSPALLRDPMDFKRFLDGMRNAIVGSSRTLDYVFWVKQGYPVPLDAPSRLKTLIDEVHRKAPIPHFPDGRPRKWLRIISGYTPGDSKALITETIARSKHHPGYYEEEQDTSGIPRQLLGADRVDSVVISLVGIGRAKLEGSTEAGYSAEGLHLDAADSFSELSFLVSSASLQELRKSLSAAITAIKQLADGGNPEEIAADFDAKYDVTKLLKLPRSNADGRVRGITYDAKRDSDRLSNRLKAMEPAQQDAAIGLLTRLKTGLEAALKTKERGGCTHILLPDEGLGYMAHLPKE